MTEYTYSIIKEDFDTGQQATVSRIRPLEVGGLYLHLGKGFKGCYRILSLVGREELKE